MSEMVERCAEALYTAGRPQGQPAIPWSRIDEVAGFGVQQSYRDQARALISAMREPTEAMLEAAKRVDFSGPDQNDSKGEWQAMIDKALEE